jgi:hypothetical protein
VEARLQQSGRQSEMNLAPRFRLATLATMGSLGAVGGHVLGYWVAHPHAHERDAVLEASGHGYMEMAIAVALVAGLMALLGQFALGLLDRGSAEGRGAGGRWRTWATLALVQTLVFLSVEVAERMLNGLSGLAVIDEPAFWLGLPLQAVIAACGVFLLTLARKAGAAIGRATRVAHAERVLTVNLSPTTSAPVLSWFGFTFSLRGPPPIS